MRWRLTAPKPIPGYPARLEHFGHHLLKRRPDLGLQQKAAANHLGADGWNLRNWEANRHQIHIRFYPAIIAFLGYNPLPEAKTRGEKVRRERVSLRWSRLHLGRVARVDEVTARRMEEDTPRMARRATASVLRVLGLV